MLSFHTNLLVPKNFVRTKTSVTLDWGWGRGEIQQTFVNSIPDNASKQGSTDRTDDTFVKYLKPAVRRTVGTEMLFS